MEPGYGTEFLSDERSKDQKLKEEALAGPDGSYDPGFHSANLFDQDEGAGGERIDPATGKPIDNSTFTASSEVLRNGRVISLEELENQNSAKPDDADQWLAREERRLAEAARKRDTNGEIH